MTKLSVNINKLALIRNSRGGNNPNILKAAIDCENFGADGITVHPRPDERHIKYSDVYELKNILRTELNIEGNPDEKKFLELVQNVKPAQVTLVPDANNQLTSDHGWDTIANKNFLEDIIGNFKSMGIRTSIFVDANVEMVEGALETGADRIELYTEFYASTFTRNPLKAIENYILAAKRANELGLGINAGHDLDKENLKFFAQQIPNLLEVSIGHALICDSIYLGLENTIQIYKRCLNG
ncbi:MAG: pyridoxine 5'-phosphate synthase [Bacteroidia bacterium]|jgi:pyridoxine 5-phosphate synthase|nr:pyridoxine 5'-phosphate synthase [Bacteroidia bacterium]